MGVESLTIGELITAQKLCEARITESVSQAVALFQDETGLSVESIYIDLVDTTVYGGPRTSALGSVEVKVASPF